MPYKAYPTAGALLCTSTRLLIQVATGTMDSLPALQADCSASWEVHAWACVSTACLLHPQERRQSITLFSLCMHITCRLCQAGHACICPLATREGEQAIKRFALSDQVQQHSDACVRTALPRSCIYVSPCLLGGLTGCTMRCFGAWEQAMHHARRGSNSRLRG